MDLCKWDLDDIKVAMEALTCKESVDRFAKHMKLKLAVNSHKGDWHDCDPGWLFFRLVEEVGELGRVVFHGEGVVEHEAADVANFAMMIAEQVRRLRLAPSSAQRPPSPVGTESTSAADRNHNPQRED